MRPTENARDESRTITDATIAAPRSTFADLGLPQDLLATLAELGYEEPTPIQREAIPPLLEGRDLLGNAATGTGKTAAFALPALARLAEAGDRALPGALVLVPTRELAIQVSEAVAGYGRALGTRVVPVYGGQPIHRQLRALHGADVVVATPGRALDHIRRGSLRLDAIRVLVLDEADEMLDMGFADDLNAILAETPEDRQTVLFSATMPARIGTIARTHLREPVRVRVEREAVPEGEAPRVSQSVYVLNRADKATALARLLDVDDPGAAIVFCRTRVEVEELVESLRARGRRAEALHGGMDQEARDRVMARVRARSADLLVATDVAARGLDIDHLTHVVNHDVPSSPESYVHRIGRVGRAGREGTAITLAEPRELRLVGNIERLTGQRITRRTVPTVAELRARRLHALRARVRDAADRDAPGELRDLLAALTEDLDPVQVALAALGLAAEGVLPGPEEADIPEPGRRERPDGPRPAGRGAPGGGRPRGPAGSTAQVWIGAGRQAGIRPQDLVGAVAGESSLSGRDVGAIAIFDRHSLVEVPAAAAEEVIAALRASTIKGRRVPVRRGHEPGRRPPSRTGERRPPREHGRG